MLLLVGLGNPGSNYTNTRHNIGFKIIDAINAQFKLSKQKPKFKGLLTTGNIDQKKIYAIKPLTFMNNSGTAIKELIDLFIIIVPFWLCYLKKFDQAGSLTSPSDAGSLNFAPLRLNPASILRFSSLIP